MAKSSPETADAVSTVVADEFLEATNAGLTLFDPMEVTQTEPTNMVLYGFPGSGKTYLAATAPSPLIIDLEKGAGATARAALRALEAQGYDVSRARVQPINYIPGEEQSGMNAMTLLRRVYAYLAAGNHPFESVIIDPFSELQKIIMAEVIERYPGKRDMDNQPRIQDWGKAFDTAIQLVSMFRALPMHTIILAHVERTDDDEARLSPLVQGKKVGPYLEGAMGLMGYLYTHKSKAEDGSEAITRILQVQDDGRIRAKNRGGKLPPAISDPNLTDIFAMVES